MTSDSWLWVVVSWITPDIRLASGYPLNRLVFRVFILEKKNILDKFHAVTTTSFKIKYALAQMKPNIYWTTVSVILIHLTVNTQLHPVQPVYTSHNVPCTKQNRFKKYQYSSSYSRISEGCFPRIRLHVSLFWQSIQSVLGKICFG